MDLTITTKRVEELTRDECREMFSFAKNLMAEEWERFMDHVSIQEIVYIFRTTKEKELVAFSFWRVKNTPNSRTKVIYQGKLRIAKEYRRRSLHVIAQVMYFFRKQFRDPFSSFYLMSIATLFNFVSMKKSISKYWILTGLNRHSIKDQEILSPVYSTLNSAIADGGHEVDGNFDNSDLKS
eukprot:TRINITY_DN3605_c0_g1_i2.p1 TRINITY_DN3605_c0_g1~~TRINITY_DN3605_c0_g1_i2.p1  ORF type:complete len:181 (-),score=24.06 TRINITY_DN3605_c0_g1_i2:310-852(-)